MKKYFINFICTLPVIFLTSTAFASSLDELYRDIIRSDNQGYLPLFVKNRETPDVLGEDKIILQKQAILSENKSDQTKSVNLINPIPIREAVKKKADLKWSQTLEAIKENKITAVELDELYQRFQNDDPKAVEVLAWMYTKGIGVNTDYVEAYRLYRKAANMNIAKANENAKSIFKAMNNLQRQQLKNF